MAFIAQRKTQPTKICTVCGESFAKLTHLSYKAFEAQNTCSAKCRGITQRKNKVDTAPKVDNTEDLKQQKHNIQTDDKYKITFEQRTLKPGSPEFEEIAKKVTPLQYIRKESKMLNKQTYYGMS